MSSRRPPAPTQEPAPIIPDRPPPPPPPDRREPQPSQPDDDVGELPTRAPSRRDDGRLPVRRNPSHVIVDLGEKKVYARTVSARGAVLTCAALVTICEK